MNLSQAYFVDDAERVHSREIDYVGQFVAQLRLWHELVWSAPRVPLRHEMGERRGLPGGRGLRAGSVPQQVLKQLSWCDPEKLLASDLCGLLPHLPRKPISVALYELSQKGFLICVGRHNTLRYGMTEMGRELLANHER